MKKYGVCEGGYEALLRKCEAGLGVSSDAKALEQSGHNLHEVIMEDEPRCLYFDLDSKESVDELKKGHVDLLARLRREVAGVFNVLDELEMVVCRRMDHASSVLPQCYFAFSFFHGGGRYAP